MSATLRTFDDLLLGCAVSAQRFLFDEHGQTLAEYGLILAVVAVGVVVPTMILFRGALASGFDSMANCLNGSC